MVSHHSSVHLCSIFIFSKLLKYQFCKEIQIQAQFICLQNRFQAFQQNSLSSETLFKSLESVKLLYINII